MIIYCKHILLFKVSVHNKVPAHNNTITHMYRSSDAASVSSSVNFYHSNLILQTGFEIKLGRYVALVVLNIIHDFHFVQKFNITAMANYAF